MALAAGGQPQPSSMSAAIPASPQNAFGVGRTVARTFSTWWRHVVVFTVLTLLAYVPLVLLAVLGDAPVPGISAPNPNPLDQAAVAAAPQPSGFGLATLAMMLLFLVELGAVTQGVINHLAGKTVSFGGMIAAGVRRALPVLVVGVISYLLVALGLILLVVPGVILACALAAAIPAAVVERPGILGALKRSFALTKGKRSAIFAIFLVLGVIAFGVSIFGSYLLPALLASVSPLVGVALGLVVNAAFGTLLWIAPAVIYHDLRVEREGVATAQLAAVFE